MSGAEVRKRMACDESFDPKTAFVTLQFQGQSAGPDHTIKCIITQPGSCSMEKLCPGLLYMFISRGSLVVKCL